MDNQIRYGRQNFYGVHMALHNIRTIFLVVCATGLTIIGCASTAPPPASKHLPGRSRSHRNISGGMPAFAWTGRPVIHRNGPRTCFWPTGLSNRCWHPIDPISRCGDFTDAPCEIIPVINSVSFSLRTGRQRVRCLSSYVPAVCSMSCKKTGWCESFSLTMSTEQGPPPFRQPAIKTGRSRFSRHGRITSWVCPPCGCR